MSGIWLTVSGLNKFVPPFPGIMKVVLGSSVKILVNIFWSKQVFGAVAEDYESSLR